MLSQRESETIADWVIRIWPFYLFRDSQCDNEFPGVDNQGERCRGIAVVCDLDGIHYCRKCRILEGL